MRLSIPEERTPLYPTRPVVPLVPSPDARAASGRTAAPSAQEGRERIRMLVEVAAANESSISLEELLDLLPHGLFPSAEAVGRFIAEDELLAPRLAASGDEVTLRGREDLAARRRQQRGLAGIRLQEAGRFLDHLARICPWVELAGISGSTAYGGAKPSDDIDFFLVTRPHRLWITMLLALLRARTERMRSPGAPVYCFNRILERPACERTFRERRDALFAREALNLRVLRGEPVYRHLVASAAWMAEPFPSLYAARVAAGAAAVPGADPDGATGRLLNAGAMLVLGPYLWMAGLVRNVRLRREGRDKECFRTVVRPDLCATESVLYDELREEYRRAFA